MSIRTFFLRFGDSTRKVFGDDSDFMRLPQIVRARFSTYPEVQNVSDDELTFDMKDKEFDVVAKIGDYREIYDGAVVIIKIRGSAQPLPPDSLVKQVREAKAHLASSGSKHIIKRRRTTGDRFIVRIRGLPWDADASEIQTFFNGIAIIPDGVAIVKKLGQPSGEAFVEFSAESELREALKRDKQNLGARYIEVYRATLEEAERGGLGLISTRPQSIPVSETSRILQMRGLPYTSTEVDVHEFFDDIRLVAVHFPIGLNGRPSGDCFVEVANENDERKALSHSKHNMGERYIDITKSDADQLRDLMRTFVTIGPDGTVNVPPGAQRCIGLRGLPFGSTELEINSFFQPVNVIPSRIHRKADGSEAFCEFFTVEDACRAFQRNRAYIGSRYIELKFISFNEMALKVGIPPEDTAASNNYYNNGFNPQQHQPFGERQSYGMNRDPGGMNPSQNGMNQSQNYPGSMNQSQNYPGSTMNQHQNFQNPMGGEGMFSNSPSGNPVKVKMRGLPWSASQSDIANFFSDHPLLFDSINLTSDASGRSSGQAYVHFPDLRSAQAAVDSKHRKYMSGRYVELMIC